MNGEQSGIRDPAHRTWNPRSLSRDNGSASSRVDGSSDRELPFDQSLDGNPDRNVHSPDSGELDGANGPERNELCGRESGGSPADDSVPNPECSERYSGSHPVPTDQRIAVVIDDDPDSSDIFVTISLLDDSGATVGRYRGHLVKTITEAEYQQNFVNLTIVVAIALVIGAIGGKVGNLGAWMLGLMLAAFLLFEGLYYSKNGSFFTYKVGS